MNMGAGQEDEIDELRQKGRTKKMEFGNGRTF